MATFKTATYTWTATNTSATTLKDGGAVNGYFTKTSNQFDGTGLKAHTIIGMKMSLGSCQVVCSGGAYIQLGDRLQTMDLSYSSYGTYQSYVLNSGRSSASGSSAGTRIYCKPDVCSWMADCAAKDTVVRLTPRAALANDSQQNALKIAKNFSITVDVYYISDYNMSSCYGGYAGTETYAGQPFTVNLYGNKDTSNPIADRTLFNYITELNISVGGAVMATVAGSMSYADLAANNEQFTFTVPEIWSTYYPDTSNAGNVIGICGYAYDTRTVFTKEIVTDHGFGFSDIEQEPMVSQTIYRYFPFHTGNTINAPVLNTFAISEYIRGYDSTTKEVTFASTDPLNPSAGDLWFSPTYSKLYQRVGSAWSEEPFLKDYTGISFHLTSTTQEGASLYRYYIMAYKLQNGNNSLQTNRSQLIDSINKRNNGDPAFDEEAFNAACEQIFLAEDLDGEYTIESLPWTGIVYWVAYARDTRDQYSMPQCFTMEIHPYSLPTLTVNAARWNYTQNQQDDEGTYIKAVASLTFDKVNLTENNQTHAWNQPTLTCSVNTDTIFSRSASTILQNSTAIQNSDGYAYSANGIAGAEEGDSGSYNTLSTYAVVFVYTDNICTVTKTVMVSPKSYTMHFLPGGLGVGIGRACAGNNHLEINPNWQICLGKFPLISFVGANESLPSNSASNPIMEGCICLKAIGA